MSLNPDNFNKYSISSLKLEKKITGIDEFLNTLGFHYFSNVKLKNINSDFYCVHLVLEIDCNLKLLELLSYFNAGRWGNNGKKENPLQQCLHLLSSKNKQHIDIEEVTLYLNDTSIVIKRIYQNSIASQFNFILKQIANNYVFLSKGLTQEPYEIFVPIFEVISEFGELADIQIENTPKSYYEFWGIYLDKDDEASIFDVNKNTYINGELEFLTE